MSIAVGGHGEYDFSSSPACSSSGAVLVVVELARVGVAGVTVSFSLSRWATPAVLIRVVLSRRWCGCGPPLPCWATSCRGGGVALARLSCGCEESLPRRIEVSDECHSSLIIDRSLQRTAER